MGVNRYIRRRPQPAAAAPPTTRRALVVVAMLVVKYRGGEGEGGDGDVEMWSHGLGVVLEVRAGTFRGAGGSMWVWV
jgi:hypothetical protein